MKTVNEIINSKKCLACGMCKSVCPKDAIELFPNEKSGFWEVKMNGEKCVSCGLCLASCPVKEDVLPKADTLGAYKAIALCRSTDEAVRKNATSGGAVNSIIRYLIENGVADSVLCIKEDMTSPFETDAVIINKANCRLLSADPRDFASRYVSYPVLSKLKECTGRTAVVGTPCQIKALAEKDKNNEYIKIAIACSGATSYKASEIIKERLANKDYKLYYRGNGWPGYNTLTNGEDIKEKPHGKSYFEKMFTSQIFRSRACRCCPSHFAQGSDLTFFDYWNREEIKNEKLGNSACIIRTNNGKELFESASALNYVEKVKDISEADALKTQSAPLKYKSRRPYGSAYFKLIDFIWKMRLYRLIPLKWYKYFCRMLAKQ